MNIKKEHSVQLETLPVEVLKLLDVASIDGIAPLQMEVLCVIWWSTSTRTLCLI